MPEAPSIAEAVTKRPEDELLVCCARVSQNSGNTHRIEALFQEDIDWEYLLEMAANHRMLPLLHWHANAVRSEAMPEDVLSQLRYYFQTNKLRALLLARELLNLCELFERRGIPVIPYKGPVLAAYVYGDLGLRTSGDLDMLVRRDDVLKAKELLMSRGYEPTLRKTDTRLTPAQEAAFLRFEREYPFEHHDNDLSVEVHWGIIDRHFPFSIDLESVRERLQRVSLGGGRTVPALAPEDLVLILCAHASVHFWEQLQWICDVAETVRVRREINWNLVMERASALGSERMLLLGLHLARELLGAEIPQNAARRIRTDPVVGELAGEVYEGLFQNRSVLWDGRHEKSRGILQGSLFRTFHYRLHERRRDRFRYTLHTMIDPNVADWVRYPLPEWLFPLYYVIRPLRLAGKYGQRLARR